VDAHHQEKEVEEISRSSSGWEIIKSTWIASLSSAGGLYFNQQAITPAGFMPFNLS
jgi:hypothetical protein